MSAAPASHGAISTTNLELYYTYDTGTVSGTVVTDQWTMDGNEDNVGRSALTTFTTGAKFGQAINTSTSAQTPRVTTSNAATINSGWLPGTADYSLTFWYRQGNTISKRIWGAGARDNNAANDDGLQLYFTAASGLEVAYHDPAIAGDTRDRLNVASGNTGLVFDGSRRNHIALIRTGTDLSVWVNGSNRGSTTLTAGYNIAVGGTSFREAAFGPDADVAGSAYDDAAIFHRALTNAEIGEIYNGGTGATIGSLIPEPNSAMLIALAGLTTLIRRRV